MKKCFVLMVAGMLISAPFGAHAFPTKKGDKACTECHKLDKTEAETILKKFAPEGTVTNITVAPLKSMWQIDVDAGGGKRGAFYLDFSKKYVVVGQMAPVESLGKQPPPRKVDVSKIPLDDAITLGVATAKKKVIVLTDPDCPACRELHRIMKQVLAKRNDVAFAVILYPLPMHKDAPKKVQAILCSKSVDMLDDAYAGKTVPDPSAACSTAAMERNKVVVQALEIEGTPTLVRDDGIVLFGFLPEDKLMEWIDKK
ncbi:MAG: DsbC family protein [Nitrospirae bacterium]|nr:DsbC family protein [Nitrospirota bacterium]